MKALTQEKGLRFKTCASLLSVLMGGIGASPACAQAKETSGDQLDRSVLPIHEPKYPSYKELDVRNATPPPRFDVKAPKGAPNVVVVLIDDMGFGVSEAFGGPVTTPTMNQLAETGLKYNRFHTTAVSSPTPAAVLTPAPVAATATPDVAAEAKPAEKAPAAKAPITPRGLWLS